MRMNVLNRLKMMQLILLNDAYSEKDLHINAK